MTTSSAFFLVLQLLSHVATGTPGAAVPTASPEFKQARLYVVASESFFATLQKGDAIASMGVWIKQVGQIRGFQCDSEIEIVPSTEQMRQKLQERTVDLLVLDTPDYLVLSAAKLVEAVAADTHRDQLAAFEYLLLTNDKFGVKELAELRGQRIFIASRTKSNMGLVWIETLLAENRPGRGVAFSRSINTGYRASSCVLPLFFGKLDACIVDSGNWELVRELNPQLARLRVLPRSKPLLEGLLAMPMQRHPYQQELIDALLNLHKTPAGEQLGIVFKAGPQVRVGLAQFESMAELCNRYRRLLNLPADALVPISGRLEDAAGKERH